MTKTELAEYLANLHTLMDGQEKTGLVKSKVLADEYMKHWNLLKQEIANEAGPSPNGNGSDESRAQRASDKSRLRGDFGASSISGGA